MRTTTISGRVTALATLLALAIAMLPTGATADEVTLAGLRNNVGICQTIFDDCNFDSGGFSYSSLALLASGVRGGDTIEHDGFAFTWPDTDPGEADNVEARGQTIPLLPGDATRIGFLIAGHNAPTDAHFTLHYTYVDEDGELQEKAVTETVKVSDWTLNAGGASPVSGNEVVIDTPFRMAGNQNVERVRTYVFGASIDIDPTMFLNAIELPHNDRVHLFGLALD